MTQMRHSGTLLWPVHKDLDAGGKERGPMMFRGEIKGIWRWTVPECDSSVANDDLGGSGSSGGSFLRPRSGETLSWGLNRWSGWVLLMEAREWQSSEQELAWDRDPLTPVTHPSTSWGHHITLRPQP